MKTFFTVTDENTTKCNSRSERMTRGKARAVARYRVANGKSGVFIMKAVEHVSMGQLPNGSEGQYRYGYKFRHLDDRGEFLVEEKQAELGLNKAPDLSGCFENLVEFFHDAVQKGANYHLIEEQLDADARERGFLNWADAWAHIKKMREPKPEPLVFDLEAVCAGMRIQTRDGQQVHFLAYDEKLPCHQKLLVRIGDRLTTRYSDGHVIPGDENPLDIVLVPRGA